MSERIAIYPASFDPITNGHLDLIHRASRLFDQLIVAVAVNVGKQASFSIEERLRMVREVIGNQRGVQVDRIDSLLVDYCRERGARVVIRGLRALSDFEYEFEMGMMNAHMYPDLETVFLMTNERWFYVSSSRLKEIARFGGDVSEFVPEAAAKALRDKLGAGARRPPARKRG